MRESIFANRLVQWATVGILGLTLSGGFLANQDKLIRTFSQREHDQVVGVDATYRHDMELVMEGKIFTTASSYYNETSSSIPQYTVISYTQWEKEIWADGSVFFFTNRLGNRFYLGTCVNWFAETGANTLSITPYIGEFVPELADAYFGGDLIGLEDAVMGYWADSLAASDHDIIVRLKSDSLFYTNLESYIEDLPDEVKVPPAIFAAQLIAEFAIEHNNVIVELEPGEYFEDQMRILQRTREESPYGFKIAVAIYPTSENYNKETGFWDAKYSYENYWKDADIVIINDYVSHPDNVQNSYESFASYLTDDQELFVRVYASPERYAQSVSTLGDSDNEDLRALLMAWYNAGADGLIATDEFYDRDKDKNIIGIHGGALFFGHRNHRHENGTLVQHLLETYRDIFGISQAEISGPAPAIKPG